MPIERFERRRAAERIREKSFDILRIVTATNDKNRLSRPTNGCQTALGCFVLSTAN